MESFWDYTEHAAYYLARPNYSDSVIDELAKHVGARTNGGYTVADIGAGTGNLTVMVLRRGFNCVAVEPNEEMRKHGIASTRDWSVRWIAGTGENTGLESESVNWVTMGSSFNTMDTTRALAECNRILRPSGQFTCMWNHRDLDDPIQREIETLIRRYIPTYSAGTRREDQTQVIMQSGFFDEVVYHEGSQVVGQSPENYVNAWRSTRNLKAQGPDLFETVIHAIEKVVQEYRVLEMTYTTRAWTARKRSGAQ